MHLSSSRLPGVASLELQCTGPEYSRWRRSLKYALEAKGTWKYCNGKCPMPMPKAGPMLPTASNTDAQPSLLDERRDWVKHDREVKLDIFLSLSEEVMQEVFEVGPPLPPSNLKAQELLEALDERFAVFDFEAYHHTFCHFLNLHIDQYSSLQEFNAEFSLTLEDLLDHGHPMTNVQKCSAYFSKLRCTQNPWVAKKLEQWSTRKTEIQFSDLLKESPSWSIVRPLMTKTSQNLQEDSIPEEHLDDSSASDSDDAPSESSHVSTTSSISSHSHSRQTSNTSLNIPIIRPSEPKRFESYATVRSQEVVIVATAEDIPEIQEIQAQAAAIESEKPAEVTTILQGDSKINVPGSIIGEDAKLPEWLVAKKSIAKRPVPEAVNRPLPPIPTKSFQSRDDLARSRSVSPSTTAAAILKTHSKQSSLSSLKDEKRKAHKKQTSLSSMTDSKVGSSPPQLPALRLKTAHPVLRPSSPILPTEVHPALRAAASTSSPDKSTKKSEAQVSKTSESSNDILPPTTYSASASSSSPDLPPTSTLVTTHLRRPSLSSPNLAIPWPSTPDQPTRPHSSRASQTFHDIHASLTPPDHLNIKALSAEDVTTSAFSANTSTVVSARNSDTSDGSLGLPMQGTRDSAWAYLYESKGGYLVKDPPVLSKTHTHKRTTSLSPISISSPMPLVLPQPNGQSQSLLTQSLSASNAASAPMVNVITHKKAGSLDFMTRLSGENYGGQETEKLDRYRKKKSWTLNGKLDMGRFSRDGKMGMGKEKEKVEWI